MNIQLPTYKAKPRYMRAEVFAVGFAVGFVSAIVFVILLGM